MSRTIDFGGFIDFELTDDIRGAYTANVFSDMGDVSEQEDCHVSELARRMAALDEKETFVTIRTLIKNHGTTFKRTIEYLNRERGV